MTLDTAIVYRYRGVQVRSSCLPGPHSTYLCRKHLALVGYCPVHTRRHRSGCNYIQVRPTTCLYVFAIAGFPVFDCRPIIPRSAPRACLIQCFFPHPFTEGSLETLWKANRSMVHAVDLLAISSPILDGSNTSKYICINAWYNAFW